MNAELQLKGRKRTRVWRNKNGRSPEESEVAASLRNLDDSPSIFSELQHVPEFLHTSDNESGGNPSSDGDASGQMNFTFTWGPDSQNIVHGEFRPEIRMRWYGDNLSMMITANDDDYEEPDYIGLVFDINQDDHIDVHDESYALYADNMTQPSILTEQGFLCFALTPPRLGPQKVSFDRHQLCFHYPVSMPGILGA